MRLRELIQLPLLLLLFPSFVGQAQEAGSVADALPLVIDDPTVDVGECYQYGQVEHEFRIENRGDREVRFVRLVPQAAGGSGNVDPLVVPPGESALAVLRQPVGGKLGRARFGFVLETDLPEQPAPTLVIETFVQSAYDSEYPMLDFGVIDVTVGSSADLEIGSREVDSVQLREVVQGPPFIEVAETGRAGVADEQARLTFRYLPGAPIGFHSGGIHVRTDVPQQPDYVVGFQAAVYGDVVPSEPLVPLGAIRVGESFDHTFRLTSRTNSGFTVERVEDPNGVLQGRATPCVGGSATSPCWEVHLSGKGVQEGQVGGNLRVWVGEDRIPVAYNGLIASASAQIRDLGTIGPEGVQRSYEPPQDRP